MKLLSGVFGRHHPDRPLAPCIETARLMLRPLEPDDRQLITTLLGDREVARWLVRVPHPYTLADADAFIDQSCLTARSGTAATLALTLQSDRLHRLVGVVALHSMDMRPEFGYWLGRPFWGNGLMSEAVEGVLAWAYDTLPIDEVLAGAFAGNAASLAIQHRQGFVDVGRSRRLSMALDETLDHVDTRLTRLAHQNRPPRP